MNKVLEVSLAVGIVLIMLLVTILVIVFMPGQEYELKQYLKNHFERDASAKCTKVITAEWNHLTDLDNKDKKQAYLNAVIERNLFIKNTWGKYFKDLDLSDFRDGDLQRQIRFLKKLGDHALDDEKLKELTTVRVEMVDVYATARICPFDNQKCILERQGLTKDRTEGVFATSDNYDELLYIWKAWRDATGFRTKNLYKKYVDLSNEAARANGFKDKGDQWRDAYESPLFSRKIDDTWTQIEPFYKELHKYVSRKLKDHFGDKLDVSDGLIPSHVFRTMWMQSWKNLANIVRPFKVDKINVSLKGQNFTVMKMCETANDFFKTMGLLSMEQAYGADAMIEAPTDGTLVDCNPSAFDFCDGKTFKIKICAKVGLRDFLNIHHELGHVQYFMQYANQPFVFRSGPNPGFHEAVGETIALASQSPRYLLRVKAIKDYDYSHESTINLLMSAALKTVTFLPFGLILDKWRWDVFSGSIPPAQWNARWWEYRKKYQMVKPPVARSERDFDPAAIFHFATDTSYVSFFVSQVLQFQIYKSLCEYAGEYEDDKNMTLHHCDFSKSERAGKRLRAGLRMGASRHWRWALQVMTGSPDLDGEPLLEYFRPLHEFLKLENNK